ncbi:hypothetical protein [Photobacterium leiognathi]|uniref:hypothetical protein n=1 Tax=Photobacterium leiognathi TaxID=553611 RepID=UPI0029810D38|nr:hypothetical protein [Photobacterium leiognathi]
MKVSNDTDAFFIELLVKGKAILADICNWFTVQNNINFLITFLALLVALFALTQTHRAYKQSIKLFNLSMFLPAGTKNSTAVFDVLNAENDVKAALMMLHLSKGRKPSVRLKYIHNVKLSLVNLRNALRLHECSYHELAVIIGDTFVDRKTRAYFSDNININPNGLQNHIKNNLVQHFKKVMPSVNFDQSFENLMVSPDLLLDVIKLPKDFVEHEFEYDRPRHNDIGNNAHFTLKRLAQLIDKNEKCSEKKREITTKSTPE